MKLARILPLSWREWAPAAFVCALVLLGGARLIVLSTQQRVAENREAAADLAGRTASSIEAELGTLAERARLEAERAVEVLGHSRLSEAPSVAPDTEGFWIASDGSLVATAYPSGDAAAREALAREWRAAEDASESHAIAWLAPVRHGSQWLVAARAPILVSNGTAAEQVGWAVAYRPLDDMLLHAGIADLPGEGYELALGQPTPGSDALRLLTGSPFVTSLDHVTGVVHLPEMSRATGSPEAYLVLALRPRSGWYSTAGLTANVGLLLVLTCMLGLAAHDLVQSQNRWRAALALARRRLLGTNRRLTEEIEAGRLLRLSAEHARFHDTFTGLPNRRYFMNRLDQTLRDVRGGRKQQIAVILVDIDRFKLVNDTLGQTAGDELMVQVARRFENKIGGDQGHVLARWSGDQFALLLLDVHSSDTAVAFATLLGEAFARPFTLRRHTVSVAAHVGITCVDTDLRRTEDIVREADIALSVAKRREAAGPVVYEAAFGEDVVSTVSLEADLHVALEREQLRLLFQPIVDLAAGGIVGAEALLRWRHPVEGLLSPERFLPIAEDARLIARITQWAIRRACALGAESRRVAPDKGFYVSINLAATVLDDPRLVAYVARVLQETGLPAECLRFEITEGDLTRHVGAAREVLDALHDMGIGLTLDDFGTGHSSLSYLELFPIDCVKIDRPFVNADGSDSELMRCVVHMASSLGLEAVAEKVETAAAVQALARMGCKYGQGYLLGEPVESEELLARLAGRAAMPATPDAATLVQPALPEPVAPDAPTLVLREQPAQPETPTLLVARPPEHASPDTPTLVHPVSWKPIAPDTPTLLQPASWKPVAPDTPTLVLREPPGAVAPDEPTSERPRAPDPVALVSPDATTVVHPVDEGGDVESPMRVEETAEMLADDSPTRTRVGRRRLRRSGA